MDKVKVNNQVVMMRKHVKQAKTRIINKMTKGVKMLRNKKGTDDQVTKYNRKAERVLEKIALIKKLKVDNISKLALSKAKDWNLLLKQKNIPLQDHCLALLANYNAVQKEVETFYTTHSDLVPKISTLIIEWEMNPIQRKNKKNSLERKKLSAKDASFPNNIQIDKKVEHFSKGKHLLPDSLCKVGPDLNKVDQNVKQKVSTELISSQNNVTVNKNKQFRESKDVHEIKKFKEKEVDDEVEDPEDEDNFRSEDAEEEDNNKEMKDSENEGNPKSEESVNGEEEEKITDHKSEEAERSSDSKDEKFKKDDDCKNMKLKKNINLNIDKCLKSKQKGKFKTNENLESEKSLKNETDSKLANIHNLESNMDTSMDNDTTVKIIDVKRNINSHVKECVKSKQMEIKSITTIGTGRDSDINYNDSEESEKHDDMTDKESVASKELSYNGSLETNAHFSNELSLKNFNKKRKLSNAEHLKQNKVNKSNKNEKLSEHSVSDTKSVFDLLSSKCLILEKSKPSIEKSSTAKLDINEKLLKLSEANLKGGSKPNDLSNETISHKDDPFFLTGVRLKTNSNEFKNNDAEEKLFVDRNKLDRFKRKQFNDNLFKTNNKSNNLNTHSNNLKGNNFREKHFVDRNKADKFEGKQFNDRLFKSNFKTDRLEKSDSFQFKRDNIKEKQFVNRNKIDRFQGKQFSCKSKDKMFNNKKKFFNNDKNVSKFPDSNRNKAFSRSTNYSEKHKYPEKKQFRKEDNSSKHLSKGKNILQKKSFQKIAKQAPKIDEGPLHPSWEAKRKLKTMNAKFEGKRVVFED